MGGSVETKSDSKKTDDVAKHLMICLTINIKLYEEKESKENLTLQMFLQVNFNKQSKDSKVKHYFLDSDEANLQM